MVKKLKTMKNITRLIYVALLLITSISFGQSLPKFVHVEGGTFTMGDEWGLSNKDQRPTHEVTLKSFNISQTEVTVAQYRSYCDATGTAMPKEPSWGWQDNHPIVNVSWRDAINYADWLSDKLDQKVRLPYEAEWEYAARGGNKSKGYKYSGANSIDNVGWYDGNSDNKTNAAAGKKANELGLYDMSGNVWEWCMDIYGGDYYANSPKNNPKGAAKGDARVIRGGGWSLDATFSSVAYRYGSTFDGELYDYFGFRVVSIKKK
jgi:formylglycine-generating enzyme